MRGNRYSVRGAPTRTKVKGITIRFYLHKGEVGPKRK